MKFLIIGCYGLADGYKAMSNGLRYLGHDIAFFPLFASQNILKQTKNKNYNIEEEIILAINSKPLSLRLDGYINNCSEKCNSVILWHGVDCCMNYSNMLKNIKEKTNVKLVQINWDPNPIFIKQLNSYYKIFDYIFSVNSKITKYLREKNIKMHSISIKVLTKIIVFIKKIININVMSVYYVQICIQIQYGKTKEYVEKNF